MAKQLKLITCRHCGQQIAASAKVCPHCGGKNKKPIFKRVWFWILVLILLFVGIASMGGGKDASNNTSKKVGEVGQQTTSASDGVSVKESGSVESSAKMTGESGASEMEGNVQIVYHVGDILHDGNMDIVYMSSGDYTEDNEYMKPKEGNKYIFAQFAFINTSDKSDASISFYSFECYADGYACDAYYGGSEDLSATLSAGRSTSGYVYFEVPQNAQDIEIEYEANIFLEDRMRFVFEGDIDSEYVLEKNTAAAEGALNVGETIESSDLNITYLSCFEDSSENAFIESKDGYHYVTCEFEFENISESDEGISAYNFDCFADGISCEQAFFRDDEISATLSAGRKAKGTVTFEVPDEATVIEVEYLSNYWTSNRVVFNAAEYSK